MSISDRDKGDLVEVGRVFAERAGFAHRWRRAGTCKTACSDARHRGPQRVLQA